MTMTNEKIYLIDGEPVSPQELIEQAKTVNDDFKNDWLRSTSRAAAILRAIGCVVGENKEEQP